MFECKRCGECCRWRGAVKLTDKEVDLIADFLGMPLQDFLERHTVITPDRRHLSLREKDSGECEFLSRDENGLPCCMIEAVKPGQCREFPEKWNFPGWQKICKGGNQ